MKELKIIARVIYPYGGIFGYIEQNINTKKYWYYDKFTMKIMYPSYDYNFVEQSLIKEGYIIELLSSDKNNKIKNNMKNNKINIAKILKDCPTGMKLNCTIYDDVEFDFIDETPGATYTIHCLIKTNKGNESVVFTNDGCIYKHPNAKCVIFPENKDSWKGFVPPCQFTKGDIIYIKEFDNNSYISIYEEIEDDLLFTFVDLSLNDNKLFTDSCLSLCKTNEIVEQRIATEEEKQKLFKELKVNGYKWNEESKTVEDLNIPKFKDGDILACNQVGNKNSTIYIYYHNEAKRPMYYIALIGDNELKIDNEYSSHVLYSINENTIRFAIEEEKERLFKFIKDNGYQWNAETKTLEKLIKPKFKVGDVVQDNDGYKVEITHVEIDDECYWYLSKIVNGIGAIDFKDQDDWELISNKFDITTLVPFESKVLVRNHKIHFWKPAIFGGYINNCSNDYKYIVMGETLYKYLIPYKNNEHLSCTTNDCNDYYKTWEE